MVSVLITVLLPAKSPFPVQLSGSPTARLRYFGASVIRGIALKFPGYEASRVKMVAVPSEAWALPR